MKYFITLTILFLSSFVLAEGRINVATSDENGIRWLDFYGENIPNSFGMELEVFYPNDTLSVIDSNVKKAGPQIQKGDFFSESAYEIANNVDVRKGRIRFALSLLKPAVPISGNGHLARIGFVTKTDEAVKIEFSNIKFGTQGGKVVDVLFPRHILIEPALSTARADSSVGIKPTERTLDQQGLKSTLTPKNDADNNVLIIGLLSLIGFLLFIVIILLVRRQPKLAS